MRHLDKNTSALVVVDMQHDYCSKGYYMDKAGYDTDRLRKPIEPIKHALSVARDSGLTVIYTRQYRVPGNDEEPVSSFPQTALKGETGWEIIPELPPQKDEQIFDKTTCSAFVSSNINEFLKSKGITTLIFCGNTIDVCVHSTLRTANDLGYKCITVADCCGAVSGELHKWSIESIKVEGGVFGSVANSKDLAVMLA